MFGLKLGNSGIDMFVSETDNMPVNQEITCPKGRKHTETIINKNKER